MKKRSVMVAKCPRCGIADSRVVHTSKLEDGRSVRRRRCTGCGKSIYTEQPPEHQIDSWRIIWAAGNSGGSRIGGLRDAPEIDEKTKSVTKLSKSDVK